MCFPAILCFIYLFKFYYVFFKLLFKYVLFISYTVCVVRVVLNKKNSFCQCLSHEPTEM